MKQLQRKLWLPSLLLGLFLMGTNLVGQFVTLDLIGDKNITSSIRPYKPENRAKLLHMIKTPMEKFDLETVNETVFTGIIHSNECHIPFYENWAIWLLSKFLPPIIHVSDPEKIIMAGGGLCSQAVIVLNKIAMLNGYSTKVVAFKGHRVSEVKTHKGWQLADPDWGIVYSHNLETLAGPEGPYIMQKALEKKGYDKRLIDLYIHIVQNRAHTVVRPMNQLLIPFDEKVRSISLWLKWIAPLFLILLGLFFRKKTLASQ